MMAARIMIKPLLLFLIANLFLGLWVEPGLGPYRRTTAFSRAGRASLQRKSARGI